MVVAREAERLDGFPDQEVIAEVAMGGLTQDLLGERQRAWRPLVTLPALFGRYCVTPTLLTLARRHPQLQLELSFSDTLSDLGEGALDLAVRTGDCRTWLG